MVYIYKKAVGSKTYYYLRASIRKGKRVLAKDIAYLGSSIEEIKKALQNLPKYSNEIRKAYKTINNFLESNRYVDKVRSLKLKKDELLGKRQIEIEACKLHFNTTFKKKSELTKYETFKNFIIEFAFNTTSIEGNTMNLNEARNLLIEGLTPKNKTIREIYDVQNTENVFLHLLESKEEINHELIVKIHKKLMENIDARIGYRTSDIRVIRSNFEATPAPYVKTDMDLLIQWYKKNKNMHPLILASLFHHKFEKIHPFMDGNGRTGRMLLNHILMINHYPPLVIRTKERLRYLRSLRTADKTESYAQLIDFTSDEMVRSYWNMFL